MPLSERQQGPLLMLCGIGADQSGIQQVSLSLTLPQLSKTTEMSSQEQNQGMQKPTVFHVTRSQFESH